MSMRDLFFNEMQTAVRGFHNESLSMLTGMCLSEMAMRNIITTAEAMAIIGILSTNMQGHDHVDPRSN